MQLWDVIMLRGFWCSNSVCALELRLMTEWIFTRGIQEQAKSFLDGFNEVVPLQWLQYFDERELEVQTAVFSLLSETQEGIAEFTIIVMHLLSTTI